MFLQHALGDFGAHSSEHLVRCECWGQERGDASAPKSSSGPALRHVNTDDRLCLSEGLNALGAIQWKHSCMDLRASLVLLLSLLRLEDAHTVLHCLV